MPTINVPLTAAEVTALQAGTQLTLTLVPPTPTPVVVAPPAPTPPVAGAPKPPVLKVIIAQDGEVNPTWVQDYSFSATDARAEPGDGYGNPNGIKVTTTGPWGGFLPSNPPGQSTDFSGCTHLTVAVNAPKGNVYSMYAVMGGDVPVANGGFVFTKTVDGWEVFTTTRGAVTADANGDHAATILKMCIQSKQGVAGDVFELDNWGGL